MPQRPKALRTLAEKVAAEHTALLIIDMCNDFIHPEGKTAVRAGRNTGPALATVPAIQRLREAARDAGVLTVFVQHTTLLDHASDSGPWLEARSRASYSVEDICLEDTWGQSILDELAPSDAEFVVQKHRYSGFAGTNLDLILRSRQIKTVVCTGVSTNSCVEATAREAFSLDYYVSYTRNACASWDMGLHEATLQSADKRYAAVVESEEVVDVWQAEPAVARATRNEEKG